MLSPDLKCQSNQRDIKVPALDLAVVEPREPRVEDVVEHLLDVQEVLRARVVAARHPEHAHVVPLHEAERRLEVLLNFAERDLRDELVVRVVRREPVRPVLVRYALVDAPDAVGVDDEVARPAEETRRRQAHVGAVGLARLARAPDGRR